MDDLAKTESSLTRVEQTGLAPLASHEALKAREIARIQARTVLALQRPRDIDKVRSDLLKDCERPKFADAAIYLKPIGKGIEGPSIRFAESLRRHMGHMDVDTDIEDTEMTRKVRVIAIDLQANVSEQLSAVVEKTVERSKVDPGQRVYRTRTNSYGKPVYTVDATEDELLAKCGAVASKLRRNCIIALAPADIVEEAIARCNQVCADKDAKDPAATKKGILDSFSAVGVNPPEIREYLGVPDLDKPLTNAQLADLRKLLTALREGETNWGEVMRSKKPEEAKKPAPDGKSKADRMSEELNAKEPGADG